MWVYTHVLVSMGFLGSDRESESGLCKQVAVHKTYEN